MKISNRSVVLLDRRLTVSQTYIDNEVKQVLTGVIREAIVKVFRANFYQVDFGPDIRPQYHVVSHDRYCTCALEADCVSVLAVKVHLRDGGEPAKAPRPGYFPTVPHICPVCGARAFYDPGLSSRHRGIGWSCEKGGTSHYWWHELATLQAAYAEKWKRLGVDPATFNERLVFPFKDGYDPERVPTSPLPDDMIVDP